MQGMKEHVNIVLTGFVYAAFSPSPLSPEKYNHPCGLFRFIIFFCRYLQQCF